ncbi:MAG: hypothetical protein ACUVR0_03310 [Candidatus Aminicenantales bacterium]
MRLSGCNWVHFLWFRSSKKLAATQDLAHYRPEVAWKKTDSLKGLSQTQQQAQKEISKGFDVKVMFRARNGAVFVVINHG